MKRILITGGSGQVGTELQRLAWPADWEILAPDRAALDLSDATEVAAYLAANDVAAIINAAAYTAVDRAESDVAAAWRINALVPAILAAAGLPIVHLSTDYVFDGDGKDAYLPDDPTNPLGVYGASKLGGELAVRTANRRHAIVRTSWVVSAHGNNFVKTMLRLGADRPELSVVADQHGAPTAAADLARAVRTIALRLVNDPDGPTGIWHFSNAGATIWHGFAAEIFRQASKRGGPSPTLRAITTAEYPTPARRPANSRLSTATLTRDFGIVPRPWQQALSDILEELL